MDLFKTLEKKQRFTAFNSGAENRFFLDHSGVLGELPAFRYLSHAQKPFDIVRANIVIRAMLNKKDLDEAYNSVLRPLIKGEDGLDEETKKDIEEAMRQTRSRLPCLVDGERRIFVPILSRSLNLIYDEDIFRLEEKPFRALMRSEYQSLIVDPFDAYGYRLFDSNFTNWILVKEGEGVAAFFDYDSSSIYIINNQGRLDTCIALFDRYLPKKNENHMMERILPVVDAYFRDSREDLYRVLVRNQLISSRLLYRISSDEKKILAKLEHNQ